MVRSKRKPRHTQHCLDANIYLRIADADKHGHLKRERLTERMPCQPSTVRDVSSDQPLTRVPTPLPAAVTGASSARPRRATLDTATVLPGEV